MIAFRSIFRLALPVIALTVLPIVSNTQASDLTSDPTGKAVFADHGYASTFAFDWRKGMIFVPVRVNGSKPLAFVLDTGSTRILIDRTLATGLGPVNIP